MLIANTLKTLGPRMRFSTSKPVIENYAFKLHYQLTVTLLVLFVIIVCGKEYFGEYINCVADKDAVPVQVINTYCFIMGTYTIARFYNESVMEDEDLPYPGVGPRKKYDETIHHTYYQWVPFVLFIQAICFYLPHYIWKSKEAGRIRLLVDGLKHATLAQDVEIKCKTGAIPSKQNVEKKLETIKVDILLRLRITKTWSTWLVMMEIANFVHIVLQIWITDYFLGGYFLSLGTNAIYFDNWEAAKVTPLDIVFPKVTKCAIYKYGASGSLQILDAMCVMTLNVAYEKLYLILWFWFLGVFIVSLLAVIWRITSFFLYCFYPHFSVMMFRKANRSKVDSDQIARFVSVSGYGDWLFLYYLAKNMEKSLFEAVLRRVAEEMENREPQPYNKCQRKEVELFTDNVVYDDEIFDVAEKKSF